jgi:hypothetical protein
MSWVAKIVEDLSMGKKLFVFYPYKIGNEKNFSIERFTQSLIDASGLSPDEFICYNSDSSGLVKKTLQNVNEVWSKKSCVICNTCITVGVNFDLLHFDKVYAMWKPFVSQRDFFQNMYRCRSLVSNEIHLFTGKVSVQKNSWIHSDHNDPDYRNLLRDISYEENSKGSMDVFKLFASQSGFVFRGQGDDVSKAVRDKIESIMKNTTCIFKWSRIAPMTYMEYDDAKLAIINSLSTRIDTVARVNKYDFMQMFKEDTPDAIMEELWDSRKHQLFRAICSQEYNGQRPADLIVKDLFAQNNCKYFLPEDPQWEYDIKKIKDVFDTRCTLENHRYNQELMSKILEAYFGTKVWESTKERKYIYQNKTKRYFTVYKSNVTYTHLTKTFLQYMKPHGEPEPIETETNYGCLLSEYI